MKKQIKTKFRQAIKQNQIAKALVYKNATFVMIWLMGVIIFFNFGAEPIMKNHEWPAVKLFAVFLSFVPPIIKVVFDSILFKDKVKLHEIRRSTLMLKRQMRD